MTPPNSRFLRPEFFGKAAGGGYEEEANRSFELYTFLQQKLLTEEFRQKCGTGVTAVPKDGQQQSAPWCGNTSDVVGQDEAGVVAASSAPVAQSVTGEV